MEEWITKATLTGSNYTIQGTVYANNPVISYVEALDTVNNMTFNSQTLLLTNTAQTLNGVVTIGNRLATDRIHSLTFDNLYVNFINDKNVSEFFENLIQKDAIGNDAGEVYTHLEFSDRIEFDNLTIVNQLNDINVPAIMSQNHLLYGNQYRAAANELDSIADHLNRRNKFKHFKQLALIQQTLPPEVQGLQQLLGSDYQFVAHTESNIQLYTWTSNEKTLQRTNRK